MPATLQCTSRSSSKKTTNHANLETDANAIDQTKNVTRKRTRESEDTVPESVPAPVKKARALTNKCATHEVRRSARDPKPTGCRVPQQRKRRTKAKIEAAKAAAEEAKRQKEKDMIEAKERLARMDIDGDADRAQTAAKTIRWLSDMAPVQDGKEFIGYDEVSSSSSEESEEIEDVEVSLFFNTAELH